MTIQCAFAIPPHSRAASIAAAGLAVLVLQGAPARAQSVSDLTVARTFVDAARTQDRKTALDLLDPSVSIEFPVMAKPDERGRAEGSAFVIGYFDGLFDGRQYELDSTAVAQTAEGGEVRFTAHDIASHAQYGLEVEVRHQHIVKLKLNIKPTAAVGENSVDTRTLVARAD